VRGLDYYRHTAFEFMTDKLGAQGTVLAGGRYDGLIEQLGGPHTPAIGWAAGIERLAMMLDAPAADAPEVTVIPSNEEAAPKAFAVLSLLRQGGVRADMALRGSAKRRSELARKSGAQSILYVRAADDPMGEYYFSASGMGDAEFDRLSRRIGDAARDRVGITGLTR